MTRFCALSRHRNGTWCESEVTDDFPALVFAPILLHQITAGPESEVDQGPNVVGQLGTHACDSGVLLLSVSIHWLTVMRSSPPEKKPKLAILTMLEFHTFPAATVIRVHSREYQISTGGQWSSTITCSERWTYSM